MLLSAWYVVLHRVLQLVVLRLRSRDLEIVVLRHEMAILRRHTSRPSMTTADGVFLTATSRLMPCALWNALFVTPAPLLDWHRRLVARRWTYRRRPGRKPMSDEVRELILRIARESPRWGYQRIVGARKGWALPCRRPPGGTYYAGHCWSSGWTAGSLVASVSSGASKKPHRCGFPYRRHDLAMADVCINRDRGADIGARRSEKALRTPRGGPVV